MDWKKKYEELKRQFDSVEHEMLKEKNQESYNLFMEEHASKMKRSRMIKGLEKNEVDILCDLLVEAEYLWVRNTFCALFEPYSESLEFAIDDVEWIFYNVPEGGRCNWHGSQADLLYMLNCLPLTSQKHFYIIGLIVTIKGKKTTHEKLANHSRLEPKGTKKMEALLKEYNKLIRVS